MIKGLRWIIRPNYQILIGFFFLEIKIIEVKSQANTLVVFTLIVRLTKIRKAYFMHVWWLGNLYGRQYLYIIVYNTATMYKCTTHFLLSLGRHTAVWFDRDLFIEYYIIISRNSVALLYYYTYIISCSMKTRSIRY